MLDPPHCGGGWKLVPYIEENGRSQVLDFLEDVRAHDLEAYALFYESIKPEFEKRGPFEVGPPYWEGLKGGLWEISWGRRRIYCCLQPQKRVLMLLGVFKRWRRFRDADRRICERYRADAERPDYDHEARAYRYWVRQRRGKNGPA